MAKNNKKDEEMPGFLYSRHLLWDQKYHAIKAKVSELHKQHSMKSADGRRIDKPVVKFSDDKDTDEVARGKFFVLNAINSIMVQQITGDAPDTNEESVLERVRAGLIGVVLRLEVRTCMSFGDPDVGLRIMLPQVPKKYLRRLGDPAKWKPPQGVEKPKGDAQKPQGTFDKASKLIAEKTPSEALEAKPKILEYVATQVSEGNLTTEEGMALTDQLDEKLKEKE